MTGRMAVMSDYPECALAGFKILEKGGNAFDAAVGTAAAMSLKNQYLNDLFGGDAMIIVYVAKERKLYTYNGSGWAPKAATIDRYLDLGGVPTTGIHSAHIPGSFSGWMMLLKDYGTMPLSEIFAPAIHLGENGHIQDMAHANDALRYQSRFNQEALDIYFPKGVHVKEGEVVYNKNYANLLKTLGGMNYQQAEDYVYRGPVARAAVELSNSLGGFFALDDFADFRAVRTSTMSTNYRGIDVHVTPPNSQGITLLEALNILEGYDVKTLGHNTPEYIDLLVQALNLSLEDRNKWVGDPRHVPIPFGMATKGYAATRRANDMKPGKPMPDDITVGNPAFYDDLFFNSDFGGDTTFMAVWDQEGNIVACTTSLCQSWGSCLAVPGYGFFLNNRMIYYLLDEDSPNVLKPRKRTTQTITPSIALKAGEPFLAFGTPGADVQEQAKLQIFLNMVEFGMNPQEAIEAGRFQTVHPRTLMPSASGVIPRAIGTEADRISKEVLDKLTAMGYVVRPGPMPVGRMGAIRLLDRKTGFLEAGADPRNQSTAIAW